MGFFSSTNHLIEYREALVNTLIEEKEKILKQTANEIITEDADYNLMFYNSTITRCLKADEIIIDKTLQIKVLDDLYLVTNGNKGKKIFVNF